MQKYFIFIFLLFSACANPNNVGHNLFYDVNNSTYWSYGNCNNDYYPDRFLCGLEKRNADERNDESGNALQIYATKLAIDVVEGKKSSDQAHTLLDEKLNVYHFSSEDEKGIDPNLSLALMTASLAASHGYSLSDFTDDMKTISKYVGEMPSFAISSDSYSSGLTKVCNYNCVGSAYSITVGAAEMCPLNPPCSSSASKSKVNIDSGTTTCFSNGEFTKGMNKVCKYNCVGSPHVITIGAAEMCPITVKR